MLKATSSIVNVSQITGVLPVVNGGTGVTTSTGTGSTVLSAAPTLSGNVTLSTGNLIVASGKGIDFSATPGTGTSELLNDYEEGTWTPLWTAESGSNPVIGNGTLTGTYTKIGRLVTCKLYLVAGSTTTFGSGGVWRFGGFPFAALAQPANVQASFSGTAYIDDSGTGWTSGFLIAKPNPATYFDIGITPAVISLNRVTSVAPMTWATGDSLTCDFQYNA